MSKYSIYFFVIPFYFSASLAFADSQAVTFVSGAKNGYCEVQDDNDKSWVVNQWVVSYRGGICVNGILTQTYCNSREECIRQREEESRIASFRKKVQPGDDATAGVVIEIKGNLIKIQTNDSQCSQRDYNGNCTNYINTPAEKWFKRSEIYPR